VSTRQVVGRRKRLALVIVGSLLRDHRLPERTASDDAPEGTWSTPELTLDGGTVAHGGEDTALARGVGGAIFVRLCSGRSQ
jgi:hypothetical protein